MKTLIIIALLSGTILTAQKKESIPAEVKTAFAKDFPNTKASWEMEGKLYEAEFEWQDVETSATYDQSGNRKELETEIKISELPSPALEYLKKNYSTAKIKEAAKITDDKNNITFEVEIKKDGKNQEILFDTEGNFIK